MKTSSFQHALHSLGHPITLAALVLILLNALWLQPLHPSWWSGKLGDLGWMVAAPLVLALPLSLVFKDRRRAGWAAILSTGLIFTLLKTVTPLNSAFRAGWFDLTGAPLKLALDASDLLALSGLAVAAWIWFRPVLPRGRALQLAGAGLTALALLADSAAPLNLGVVCVAAQEDALIAYRQFRYTSGYIVSQTSEYWNVYTSSDGGLTWSNSDTFSEKNRSEETKYEQLGAILDQCAAAAPDGWIDDPRQPGVSYLVVNGEAVYRSSDNRATLARELDLADNDILSSAAFDPQSGNLVLGLTGGGLAVRTADGWQRPPEEQW